MTRQTIPEIFGSRVKEYGSKLLYQRRDGWSWKQITWLDFSSDVKNIAAYFMDSGLEKGDKVLMASANTMEAIATEIAVYHLGAAIVPLGSKEGFNAIYAAASDSAAKFIVLEHDAYTEDFIQNMSGLPDLQKVIYFPAVRVKHDNIANFQTVRKAGLMKKKKLQDVIEGVSLELGPDTAAAYFPTDSGELKEVTQGDITSALSEIARKYGPINTEDQAFSYIRTACPFSKFISYLTLYKSCMACTAESREDFYMDIVEVKPTILMETREGMEKIFERLLEGSTGRPPHGKTGAELGSRVKYIFTDALPDDNVKSVFMEAGMTIFDVPELNALIS